MYPSGTEFPVYCRECWFSDRWDPLSYGRDYDFSKPFFSQFKELIRVVPRIALQIDKCVDCDYTNQIVNCKNCYLVFSAGGDENCRYDYRVNFSKNVHDSFVVFESENCYEAIESDLSNGLRFCQNIGGSLDLSFCFDLAGCQSCFMTANRRRASFIFKEEQLSREEYAARMGRIDTGSYQKLEEYKKEFRELREGALNKFASLKNVNNFSGNFVRNAKSSHHCFNGINLENCAYIYFGDNSRDCMDINNSHGTELCYDASTVGVGAYHIRFCVDAWPEVRNLEYCDTCRGGVSDLFGCISVQKQQYCILNKPYSKERYVELVRKIRAQMNEKSYVDRKGRVYQYGEFFPIEITPFAYNETMAHDYFPLTESGSIAAGYSWKDMTGKSAHVDVSADQLPDHIKNIREDITSKIIGCLHMGRCNEKCTVGFKVTPDELNFYKQGNIALPRLCPNCRHYERLTQASPLKLWHRQCMCAKECHTHQGHCPNEFETSYAPDRKEIVYCESCYNAEVV